MTEWTRAQIGAGMVAAGWLFAGVWALPIASAASAVAQPAGTAVGEIVVTAEKNAAYDPHQTPHVTLTKRADNLITEVRVVCDTRDPTLRRNELKDTLRSMIRAAGRSGEITLGVGDEVVGAFDETMLDKVIEPDRKADTNVARVVIKTAVRPADTFDAASGRILKFIETTPKVGRTEVLREEDWNLTIVGPERNRATLLGLIAADAKATAADFGPGYGVTVDNLQHPIEWYQQGPLDLALFIAYRLEVSPLPRP